MRRGKTRTLDRSMDGVTLISGGRETHWVATLLGYEPGAVVQLELCIAERTFPLARIFPPYKKGGDARLEGLSGPNLATAVLHLFRDGELEVNAGYLVQVYDDYHAAGRAERLLHGAPIYIHPDLAV